MLKAVLFDMDGVLADTEPLHFKAVQVYLAKLGIKLPDSHLNEYVGLSEEDTWKSIMKKYILNIEFTFFEGERRKELFEIIKNSLLPAPGAMNLIKELKHHNIKACVVTSSGKEIADMILEKIGIRKHLDDVVSADDVKKKKPNSEPYVLAMKRLGITSGECVAIEDSGHGMAAAKEAGIFCFGVKTSYNGKILGKADSIITSLDELTIKKINKAVGIKSRSKR